MGQRGGIFLAIWVVFGSGWLLSCGSRPDSPEAQVRAFINKAEVAAEQKDLGTFRDLISDRYLDEFRHDKQAILGVLSFHFFRNQSIYLLTRIQTIAFPEARRAEAVILVATAGQPIRGTEELVALRADLFRFDVSLADTAKGDWKVTRAQWRRVELKDFL